MNLTMSVLTRRTLSELRLDGNELHFLPSRLLLKSGIHIYARKNFLLVEFLDDATHALSDMQSECSSCPTLCELSLNELLRHLLTAAEQKQSIALASAENLLARHNLGHLLERLSRCSQCGWYLLRHQPIVGVLRAEALADAARVRAVIHADAPTLLACYSCCSAICAAFVRGGQSRLRARTSHRHHRDNGEATTSSWTLPHELSESATTSNGDTEEDRQTGLGTDEQDGRGRSSMSLYSAPSGDAISESGEYSEVVSGETLESEEVKSSDAT